MSFSVPPEFFVTGAAAANAKVTQRALAEQTAEMQRLLMLGRDIPCPYCSQLIAKDAIVCNQCQGVLSIGSWEAIRAVLLTDPTLAFRDSDSFTRLASRVSDLEVLWTKERLVAEEMIKYDNQVKSERKIAETERLRQEALDQEAEKKKLANDKIEAMGKSKRFLYRNKVWLSLLLSFVLISPFLFKAGKEKQSKQAVVERVTLRDKAFCSAIESDIYLERKILNKFRLEMNQLAVKIYTYDNNLLNSIPTPPMQESDFLASRENVLEYRDQFRKIEKTYMRTPSSDYSYKIRVSLSKFMQDSEKILSLATQPNFVKFDGRLTPQTYTLTILDAREIRWGQWWGSSDFPTEFTKIASSLENLGSYCRVIS